MDRANAARKDLDLDLPRVEAGSEPAYRRLYEAFRLAIVRGQLKAGQRLPASRQLAASYGVARITVLQAYEQLCAEGYLVGRRGAGTFVSTALPETFLRSLESSRQPVVELRSVSRRYVGQRAFLSGCPDLESFPRELWVKLFARHIRGSADSLSPAGHEDGGYRALREAIAGHLATHRGLRCEADQVLILNGSQSGIELVARMMIRPGDRVALESPGYRGIASSFRLNGAELIPCEVDGGGMRLEGLESGKRGPKLAIVTPCRQFPTGVSMPVGRRVELLEWANRSGSWILEDDYDSEFRFHGKPLPAMQGMDTMGRVLYLGTFSRSMFPDLRIGYLVTPKALRTDFLSVWGAGGMNPSVSLQATLADFIVEGHYLRHLRRMRQIYSKRSHWLADRIQSELGDWFDLEGTDGGLHFNGYFRKDIDAEKLAAEGERRGVSLFPISRYAMTPLKRDGFLFGFARYKKEEMERAISVLKAILKDSSLGF